MAAFLLLAATLIAADTQTGEARGGIQDVENLLPIFSSSVTLTNVDRGWKKQAMSDAEGNYVFIQLEVGSYSLHAEKEGYYPSDKQEIFIRLNTPKVVVPPFKLRKLVTTPTQQITVTSEGLSRNLLIDATSAGPSPTVLATLSEPGETAFASTLDPSLRFNFDDTLIQLLPLRGVRPFDQLALFAPGVFRVPFSSGEGPAVGIGVGTAGQFSVNGLRGRSNNFTIDGSDNNDEDIGVRRQGFLAATPQTIDSIQDVQIVTAGWTAEFGRNAGSVVNAVSKSGGRKMHGRVYSLFNGDGLNSQQHFDQLFTDKTNTGVQSGGSFPGKDYSSQQWGGVVGGPLIEDRLFYFASAEGQRVRGSTLRHFVVPTGDERGFQGRANSIPIDKLGEFFSDRDIPYSDVAGKGVFSLYPLPNNPAGPFGDHTYSEVKRNDATGGVFSYKSDLYLSSKHSLSGRYDFTNDHALLPFTSDAVHSSLGTRTRTQNLSLFLNSRLEEFASAFRASYGRTRLAFPPGEGSPLLFGSDASNRPAGLVTQAIDTSYGRFGPFGSTGAIGQLAILPYSTVGVDVFNFPQGRVDNTYQLGEIVTWLKPRHNLRAGVDYRRSQLNSFSDRNFRPLVAFGYGKVSSDCMLNPFCPFATKDGLLRGTDLATFGVPAGFLQTLSTGPVPDSTIGLRINSLDLFVQDDWKVRRNLTLNLGLRYEIPGVATETNRRIEKTFGLTPDQFGHLQPTGTNQATINAGNRAFDTALNALQSFLDGRTTIHDRKGLNFSPRIGLAWDPTGSATTSVRAGFGLFYDANLGAVTSQSRNVFPTFVPINLDANFLGGPTQIPPNGLFLLNSSFLTFKPTNEPLIRPGTLNSYNLSGNSFATGLGTLFLQAPPSPGASFSSNGLAFTLPEKDWRSSYAEQWTISADHQFGRQLGASLTYVGTRALHLPRFTTPNAGLMTTPVLFSSFNNPLNILDFSPSLDPNSAGRPHAGLGAYTVFEDRGQSIYHSLQASVEKRMSRGFQFRGSWTWAHSIDQVSDVFDGRGFFSLPQDSNRPDLDRASSNFDVRHRVAGIGLWQRRQWTVAATAEFQTGQPYTVNTAVDRNLDGNLTDRVGAGRNALRADGLGTIDMAVQRQISLANETSIALRIEAFNLLNSTSLGIPIRVLESPGFGKSFDTQLNSRTLRLGAKFNF